MSLTPLLESLRSKEISFDEFYRRSLPRWRRMAAYLLRRWEAPLDVSPEDVVQELVIAAWQWVDRFDPERGPTIERYVVFNSMTAAKRWLHGRRAAYRRSDRSVSRNMIPFSAFSREGEGPAFEERQEAIGIDLDALIDFSSRLQSLDDESLTMKVRGQVSTRREDWTNDERLLLRARAVSSVRRRAR